MSTEENTISRWFDEGICRGATHMITVFDDVSRVTYPVYVAHGQDIREVTAASKHRVIEIYNLLQDKEDQLDELFSINY